MNVYASNTWEQSHENYTDTHLAIQWEIINWERVEKHVNRIQTRIAKAVKANKWNLVKRLQHLITNSYYAKLLAIRHVTTNKGRKTSGIDGVRWVKPEDKMHAVSQLSNKGYKALPLKRVYIEKYGKKEKRPLGIPTMRDRAMQALHLISLEPIAETTADRTSFGFRKYRSPQDAKAYSFTVLCRKTSARWVLEGDIKGCFDNISHEWILENIPMNTRILRQFLKAGFIFNKKLHQTDQGTPQGGPISATLANMTLDGMETAISKKFWTNSKGKMDFTYKHKSKINLIRFADDFIISAADKQTATELKAVVSNFLSTRTLTLSEEKTTISNIEDGHDFLGWNFRKYNQKLIIQPSCKSVKRITEKLSRIIRENRSVSQQQLIRLLNPIIIGWANYHQSACSKRTFSVLDSRLWNMLWKWAKRRHPKKGKKWVKERYWTAHKTRQWIFKDENVILTRFSDKPIVRHACPILDKNPFLDRDYFEARKNKQKKQKKIAYLRTTAAHLWDGS